MSQSHREISPEDIQKYLEASENSFSKFAEALRTTCKKANEAALKYGEVKIDPPYAPVVTDLP